MPFLKAKVAIAHRNDKERMKEEKSKERELFLQKLEEQAKVKGPRPKRATQSTKLQETSQSSSSNPKAGHSGNNIMKNYSRALLMFALSDMAVPSLQPLLNESRLEIEEFRRFIQERKAGVNCIKGLRELLLITEADIEQEACFKKMFQKSSEEFLKHFSVNWIFNSKITDRKTHLKYRFKILRRVRNPGYFTYLEDFSK